MTDLTFSDGQRRLLAKLMAGSDRDASDFPTSHAQRRQWLLHQLAPGASGYTMPIAVRLRGRFDVAALRLAVADVAERHESLRTVFPAPYTPGDISDGRPVQRVHRRPAIPVELRDRTGAGDPAALPAEELAAAVAAPFDLAEGPLVRVTVWRLAADDHVLLVAAHHIVADGWSAEILLRDLAASYQARRRGVQAALPPLPIQPADYAVWEAGELSAGGLREHLEHWRGELDGAVPALDLPTDRPRPAAAAGPAGTLRTVLDPGVTDRIRGYARQHHTTEFAVLLAAFAVVLGRFTGRRDVVVGTPMSGRVRRELADLVGCFVNTLPVRVRWDAGTSTGALLAHVRAQSAAAQRHQLVPLEMLVERLVSGREHAGTPLFNVVFTVQDALRPAVAFDGLAVEAVELDPTTAKFDLTCVVARCGDRLDVQWEYRADLLDASTVGAVAAAFGDLAAAMPADLDRPVAELAPGPVTVLTDRPPTPRQPDSVPARFARQVTDGPDRIAVWDGATAVTYRELDRRANRLAHALRAAGAGPETPVGVCLPRSADYAVACLAAVKAGGYYVPLDPSYPPDRLQYMIDDSGIRHLVTSREHADLIPGTDPLRLLVDEPADDLPDTQPDVTPHPGSLCLCVYTSGSTGRPKAVGITHQAVVDLVVPGGYCGFEPGAVVLWISSVSFDVATWEIWGTLLHGGTGVVAPQRSYTAADLRRLVTERAVTVALLTPALFNAVIDEDPAALAGLRWLLAGGEALSATHVRAALQALPGTRLMNAYGPAEITTLATCHPITDEPVLAWTVPIGTPVGGTTLTVVDGDGRPVPPGAAGELWLSGSGLARGYLGRPALTAERFVPAAGGGRWYRTGDLVRLTGSGALVYRGRTDAQVKIRGHRIEPGEVRAVLQEQPSVARAAVVAHEHGTAGRRLVAYVVPSAPGGACDVDRLRADIARILPDYMVPSQFVVLDALPVTPNGKVDLAALPAPSTMDGTRAGTRPRTPAEDAVAAVWAAVLGVDAAGIGPDDDFFALGGHSLLAVTLAARLRDQLGVDVTLADVFERPTLADLTTGLTDDPAADAPGGHPVAPRPAPLSYAQQRLWYFTVDDPSSAAYNIPLAVRITGPLDVAALSQAIRWLVDRHEVLRSVIEEGPDGDVQRVVAVADLPDPSVVDVSTAAEPDRSAAAVLDEAVRRPFALLDGELPVRSVVIRTGPLHHLVGLVVHHIAADGWSVGVIAEELSRAYAAYRQGAAPDVAPLAVQFADVVYAMQGRQSDRDLDGQAAFWREYLHGAPHRLALPSGRPRRERHGSAGGVVPFRMDADATAAVRALATAAGCTEYVVLLAAFSAMIAGRSGQPEFLIGTPVANRPDRAAEHLVGFFANTIVLRMDTGGDPSARELLDRVRRSCVAALRHQAFPFEKVVEAVAPRRDRTGNPLFQVMFAFDNTPPPRFDLPGLTVETIAMANPATRFDITLALTERDGRIEGLCEYDADLFDVGDVASMLRDFAATAAGFAADADHRLSAIKGALAVGTESVHRDTDVARPDMPGHSGNGTARQDTPGRSGNGTLGPDTDIEATVAAVWSEVLGGGVEITDPHADFFDLGGHSFLAARITSRLSRAFGVRISARAMFEHPTLGGFAGWLRGQAGGSAPAEITRLDPSVTRGPLSFAQERLWFLAQYTPESAAYNLPLVARLDGPLDRPALRRAVRWVVGRHESLRTRYGARGDEPVQRVLDLEDAEPEVLEHDVSAQPDPDAAARAAVTGEVFRPFDIVGGELPLRVLLVRVAADTHLLACTVHHLAADGWAVQVLVRDLCAAYASYHGGGEPTTPVTPLRYLDYAGWQRATLDDAGLREGLAFWRGALAGAPMLLELPSGTTRPTVRRHRGASVPFEVGAGLTAKVRDLAQDADCTVFMVLFAAYAAALSRATGQRDLLIGTPIANRSDPATESLVGLLANTVVLRADLRGRPTVRDVLARARAVCLDAFAHQDTPFEKVVEHLAPTRDQSRSPLFQVMLALNNAPAPDLRLPDLRCTPMEPDNPTAKFDVVLNLSDHGDVLGVCEYDVDVYDEATIDLLLRQLRGLLAAFTADPDRRLSDVDLLTPAERETLLVDFNRVEARYEHRTCLHTLVEEAVDRTPDAVAVEPADDPGAALTYRQLDTAANRLAHRLIGHGVRPDDVVAVCAARSVALVIGELGVLKAGAAFLPLDPAWPAARLAEVLADSGCRVVLAPPGADLTPPDGVRLVELPDGTSQSADGTGTRPDVRVGPQHRAYVVYTSGSTGRPKGAQLEHAAIVNNLLWMQQDWPLDGTDSMLHKTASTFDVSVKEIFWPLLAGARLVLAEPGSQRDPSALVEQLDRHAITVTHFVPSMLELVLDVVDQRGSSLGKRLRYVMCGAETLAANTQRRFFGACDADLLHMYGPTETAIAVTGWTCGRGGPPVTRVPLGRPMPNCALYVLDADLHPVPSLVWGELYVGGQPLARGYLDRPAETAAAFVPDPFRDVPGSRMYRTGDLVRHGPDGLLEFRGRVDSQVKVRGFRVELGEVEAALRSHPGVRQAAAIVSGAEQSDAHLVGYVVLTAEAAGSEPPAGDAARDDDGEDIRRHLRERLPEHMVPAAVIVLAALPLNDNGKIDRAALPRRAVRPNQMRFVAPRDDLEQAVADVWSRVLGVDPIGVDDDFFALGGHSLQAARIVAQLRERFGREVPLRDMFAEPTVATVARVLRSTPENAALPRIRQHRPAPAGAAATARRDDR